MCLRRNLPKMSSSLETRLIDQSQIDPSRANENVRVYRQKLGEQIDLSGCKKTAAKTTDQFGGDVLKTHWDLKGIPSTNPISKISKQLAQDLKEVVPDYTIHMMSSKAEVWCDPEEITTISYNVSFAHNKRQVYVYFILA